MVYIRRNRAAIPARHLVLRNAQRLFDKHKRLLDPSLGDPPPTLAPGEEQLYSFYIPGIEAGPHKISVTQDISAASQSKTISDTHEFTVVAPRFTLPDGSIHSKYPAQGHGDSVETLPHVVLNDPHLPWERLATHTNPPPDWPRNRVPWLAVLVFTQDELRLANTDLNGSTSIFQNTKAMSTPVAQSTTLAINMTISDLWLTKDTTTPIPQVSDPEVADSKTDMIFLKPELFTSLVTTYDVNGKPIPNQTVPDVSRYKFLSHVRNINTTGMAEAGVEDEGLFSIVHSHRSGPLTIKEPTPVVAHLVSIEGVEALTLPISARFVALSSLHSWTYTCLPPQSLNVYTAFRAVGDTLGVLRAPDSVISALASQGADGARVAQRLTDGYSMVKYRTQTGELTAALTRSPFTPTIIPHPLTADWASLSTFGSDLQILDQEVGLMDITYDSAWQLGKTLALADQAFAAALSRIRSVGFGTTMNNSKAEILRDRRGYKTREENLASLSKSIKTLNKLPKGNLLHGPQAMVNRWRRSAVDTLDLSYGSALIEPIFDRHAAAVVHTLASTSDGPTEGDEMLYNEFNAPYSTDWMVIFGWVLDRMYLVNVPAHYLITDPSHLPPESLRFFHIDANWVDALVDGALSIANHLGKDEDRIRTQIKEVINEYLQKVDPILGYAPQIPTYGFLLRSELCTQFPDLVVRAPLPAGEVRAPILRHENIDQGVMICLFDRVPSEKEFESLTFAQPPHQQSFVAGADLSDSSITTSYKREYTNETPPDPNKKEPLGHKTWNKGGVDPPVFVWGDNAEVRTLLFPAWGEDVLKNVRDGMAKINPDYFTDDVVGSALVGLQLNNPLYELDILLKQRSELKGLRPADPTQKTVRTLKMLQPRIKKVPKVAPVEVVRKVEKEPLYLLPPPGERARLTPLSLRAPPPHHRSLRAPYPPIARVPPWRITHPPKPPPQDGSQRYRSISGLAPRTGSRSTGPVQPPIFAYSVYPSNSIVNQVPTTVGLKQDLVFSVVLQSGWESQYHLQEIALVLPRGKISGFPYNMVENYRGPGASMLSNLRFNVLVEFTDTTLNLRLLPRSVSGNVKIEDVREMSFILSLVDVLPYKYPVTVVMETQEKYVENWFNYNVNVYLEGK